MGTPWALTTLTAECKRATAAAAAAAVPEEGELGVRAAWDE